MTKIVLLLVVVTCSVLSCATKLKLEYSLSSKTQYIHPLNGPKVDDAPACTTTATHIEHVARHGSRFPTAGALGGIANFFWELNGEPNANIDVWYAKDESKKSKMAPVKTRNPKPAVTDANKEQLKLAFRDLLTYQNPLPNADEGQLIPLGHTEHATIGAAARKILYGQNVPLWDSEHAKFSWKATDVDRSQDSGLSFVKGFFGDQNFAFTTRLPFSGVKRTRKIKNHVETNGWMPFEPKNNDKFLRFFEADVCPKYHEGAEKLHEDNTKKQSEWLNHYLEAAATRLRAAILETSHAEDQHWKEFFNGKRMKEISNICSFEIVISGELNKACRLLKLSTVAPDTLTGTDPWADEVDPVLDAIAFVDDVKFWYFKGPGYDLSYKIAGVLLKDIVTELQSFVDDAQNKKLGSFRFAHAETTAPLISLLKLFPDDEHKTLFKLNEADKPTLDEIKGRKFQTRLMSPFATNLMFVVKKCLDHQGANAGKSFVKLFLNEHETLIPGCPGLWCDFTTVKNLDQFKSPSTCTGEELTLMCKKDKVFLEKSSQKKQARLRRIAKIKALLAEDENEE